MPYANTEGIVLKQIPYSESSQIIWLATRDFGRVHALAKGSRRQGKNSQGGLDVLTRCALSLIRRANSDLHILTEWRQEENFPGIRLSLDRLHAGLYLAELFMALIHETEGQPEPYDRLLAGIREISEGLDRDMALWRFELALLRLLGVAPQLDLCSQCQRRLLAGQSPHGGEKVAFFSAAAGGALCGICARDACGLVPISLGALATMKRIAEGMASRLVVSLSLRREIRHVLNECFSSLLGRPLRMARYVEPGEDSLRETHSRSMTVQCGGMSG